MARQNADEVWPSTTPQQAIDQKNLRLQQKPMAETKAPPTSSWQARPESGRVILSPKLKTITVMAVTAAAARDRHTLALRGLRGLVATSTARACGRTKADPRQPEATISSAARTATGRRGVDPRRSVTRAELPVSATRPARARNSVAPRARGKAPGPIAAGCRIASARRHCLRPRPRRRPRTRPPQRSGQSLAHSWVTACASTRRHLSRLPHGGVCL